MPPALPNVITNTAWFESTSNSVTIPFNGMTVCLRVQDGNLEVEPDIKTAAYYLFDMVYIGSHGFAIVRSTHPSSEPGRLFINVPPFELMLQQSPNRVEMTWKDDIQPVPEAAKQLQQEIQRYLNLSAFW